MNRIIELNNRAVKCLHEQNEFEACNLLTLASSICLERTNYQGALHSKRKVQHREHILSWIKIAADTKKNDARKKANCNEEEECIMPTLYDFAPAIRKPCCQNYFSVFRTCHQCRDDTNVCTCSVSPVIWYNLALCCHLLGLKEGTASVSLKDLDFYLMRSIYFYEKVLNICSPERSICSGGFANMRMAVLNNLACVYHELGREQECLKVMDCLRRNLQIVTRQNPTKYVRNWKIFQVNLMMVGAPRPAPAA